MKPDLVRRSTLISAALLSVAGLTLPLHSEAQALKSGRLRVAILSYPRNFDPAQFSSENFPLIKSLYDSLIEYTPEGKAIPNLAAAWTIGAGNNSVTLALRKDVTFHSGAPMNAEAVAVTLVKSADPTLGKNLYPTMLNSQIMEWENPLLHYYCFLILL